MQSVTELDAWDLMITGLPAIYLAKYNSCVLLVRTSEFRNIDTVMNTPKNKHTYKIYLIGSFIYRTLHSSDFNFAKQS
jgi:hypothetical protein